MSEALITAWWVIKPLLLVTAMLPALILLKAVGEYLGIVTSILLVPVFFIPRLARWAAIAYIWHWIQSSHPLHLLLFTLMVTVTVAELIIYIFAGQQQSLEACVLYPFLNMHFIQASYTYSLGLSDSLVIHLLATSLASAGPTYFLRSLRRTHVVGVNAYAQWRRNMFARKLMQRISRNQIAPRFALYLRPFSFDRLSGSSSSPGIWEMLTDGRFSGKHPVLFGTEADLRDSLEELSSDNLENILSLAMDRMSCRLVAACSGEEGWFRGAGKIQMPEETWQKSIAALVGTAQCIFVVPSMNPGTLWELEYTIINKLLGKVIFIMLADGGPSQWEIVSDAVDSYIPKLSGDYDWLLTQSANGTFVYCKFDSRARGVIGAFKAQWSVQTILAKSRNAS